MRQIAFIILMVLFAEASFGQIQQTTTSIDAATYELWLEQDWDALIETGNRALKNGFDFYYLRYRLGIAYHEKQNYQRAGSIFKKRLK